MLRMTRKASRRAPSIASRRRTLVLVGRRIRQAVSLDGISDPEFRLQNCTLVASIALLACWLESTFEPRSTRSQGGSVASRQAVDRTACAPGRVVHAEQARRPGGRWGPHAPANLKPSVLLRPRFARRVGGRCVRPCALEEHAWAGWLRPGLGGAIGCRENPTNPRREVGRGIALLAQRTPKGKVHELAPDAHRRDDLRFRAWQCDAHVR